jgi:hypothetical protein
VRELLFECSVSSNGFGQRGAELRFTAREVLSRGGGLCLPVLPGLFERSCRLAQLLRERVTRAGGLREAGREFRLTLRDVVRGNRRL